MAVKSNNLANFMADFHKIYFKEIAPILNKHEADRIKAYRGLIYYEIFWGVFFCALFVFEACKCGDLFKSELVFIVLAVNIFALAVLMVVPAVMWGKFFKGRLKEKCLKNVLKVFGNIKSEYQSEEYGEEFLRKSELFANFNVKTDDDVFVGEYNGVKYTICETELHIDLIRQINILNYIFSKYKDSYFDKCVFKGVVICFKTNKNIKTKTIITTKKDFGTRGKGLMSFFALWVYFSIILAGLVVGGYLKLLPALIVGGISFAIMKFWPAKPIIDTEKLHKINLEDPVFNKKYNVYSADEVEARYLITTAFMERFKNLRTAFGSKYAKCCFLDDTIMFAIATNKDLFEFGSLFYPINNSKHMQMFFNQLTSILQLAEHFKLDENTKL